MPWHQLHCYPKSWGVKHNVRLQSLDTCLGKLNAELFEDKYCIFCLCLLSNVLMSLLEDSPLVLAPHTGGQCRSNDPTMLLIIFAGHLLRSSIVHFVSPNERINFKFTEAILLGMQTKNELQLWICPTRDRELPTNDRNYWYTSLFVNEQATSITHTAEWTEANASKVSTPSYLGWEFDVPINTYYVPPKSNTYTFLAISYTKITCTVMQCYRRWPSQ